MFLFYKNGDKMIKRGMAALILCVGSISAHADFSGDYAPAKWNAITQGWGCGNSAVDTSRTPNSIALITVNNCADVAVWYEVAVPNSGSISFDWEMPAVSDGGGDHWAEYLIDGVGKRITSLPGADSASGTTTLNVQAGQKLSIHYKGRTNSRFVISNFVFKPLLIPPVANPVPAVGIPALIFGALGIFGASGFLSRRRRSA